MCQLGDIGRTLRLATDITRLDRWYAILSRPDAVGI